MVMLDMAAKVLSKFMARDYSPATAARMARGPTIVIFELLLADKFAIIEGCTEFCYADTPVWQALV
jgi:hypothetical protein